MKIWYQIKGRNVRLAVRRPVSFGRTQFGDRICLIQFGHKDIFALYKNGKCINTSLNYYDAHRQWLDAVTVTA